MDVDLIEVGRQRPVVAVLGALRHVLVNGVLDVTREMAERTAAKYRQSRSS